MLAQSFWECEHANGSIKTKCLNQSLFTTLQSQSSKKCAMEGNANITRCKALLHFTGAKMTTVCMWWTKVMIIGEGSTSLWVNHVVNVNYSVLMNEKETALVYWLYTFHQHFSQTRRTDCVPFGSFTVRPDHTETSLYAWWWISASRA